MKTIRRKFLFLFAVETAAILLAVLVLFNIAVSFYFDRNARAELHHTFSAMNVLVERQLMELTLADGEDDGYSAFWSLSAALTASRLSGDTEFFIFNEQFTPLFPRNTTDTLMCGALLEQLKSTDFTAHRGEILKKTAGGTFYVAGMPFDGIEGLRLYIVFVADTSDSGALLRAINLMLAAVMLLSLVFGLLYAKAAADSISSPIRKACSYAAEIGNGNFVDVPPDESTLEISRLCAGMQEMSRRLRDADQARKLFFQNASHELRTPLMSIQGYAEAIETGVADAPAEAAAVIRAESIRLNSLVGELLTLSKLESDEFDRKLETIELNELLNEYGYRLEGLALKEHKSVTVRSAAAFVRVSADERLLWQAVGNTASNCLRHARSWVLIELEEQDGQAVIRVSDDGPGFEEDALSHLFDRFYKGKGGSFGLGLAIAQKAMALLGGRIRAYNGDAGAVFDLRLDIGRADSAGR